MRGDGVAIVDVGDQGEDSGEGEILMTHAPEKRLTLFALRLAVLEKAASGLGTLGFVWATVVLLGGFAIKLDKVDFWLVTVILLIEGARIFSRSHELEWQHHSTWNDLPTTTRRIANIVIDGSDYRRKSIRRTWDSSEVKIVPYTGWFSLTTNISRILYWLQILSANLCVMLSLTRLISQEYGKIREGETDKLNRKAALNIFYSLALSEALLFLLEKCYWEWNVRFVNLLEQVNEACGFDQTIEMIPIKRFFYDAFSRCIEGSIFDGLKMDMVSFSQELLASDSHDEQLMGARILLKFANDSIFAADTLRKIGSSTGVMTIERLVEMLNWKNHNENEIRFTAANIVLNLAGKKQNTLRLTGIPGCMESISSLLYSDFNRIGLRILKKLARHHDNCCKIGNTRGLLQKIVDLTGEKSNDINIDTDIMKFSLEVLKQLAATSGKEGRILRRKLSENVFTMSNMRDILRHEGEDVVILQKLSIQILTSLAKDQVARDRIGGTGGIIRQLIKPHPTVKFEAEEALMMLTLESKSNCSRIAKLGHVENLVKALDDPIFSYVNSAKILMNLCVYGDTETKYFDCLRSSAGSKISEVIFKKMMEEEMKSMVLEASIGLGAEILKLVDCLNNIGIEERRSLAKRLMEVLREHEKPCINIPGMRRYAIDMAIGMMRWDEKSSHYLVEEGLQRELQKVEESSSELESFLVFSENVGMIPQTITIQALVEIARTYL